MQLQDAVRRILGQKGSQVYSISPYNTVFEALEKLAEKDTGALVVMEGDDVVGMVTERDYARKVFLTGRSSPETMVHEIMTAPAVTVSPGTTVDECMQLMTSNRCRHLPVVENGKAVGVVSIGDLVNWIITTQDFTIHELENYIMGRVPAGPQVSKRTES
jgi:CBS domain-containing protein